MTKLIISVVIGLFIWMMLPNIIYGKKKVKKQSPQHFVVLTCKIVGVAVMIAAIINFITRLINF